ncbi:hypothetical protein SAMN05216365_101172 [Porphyromonadaceae bacterium NLAE-zl-C104]|nr:hypothetical protein SAMN05216365_101172 [Porphyromonadaceae bacterium NLAE-zl-C104]
MTVERQGENRFSDSPETHLTFYKSTQKHCKQEGRSIKNSFKRFSMLCNLTVRPGTRFARAFGRENRAVRSQENIVRTGR